MLCRTVAVAVTRSWLQRLCGICPRAWLKDATPSSEPSSWCCRAWMNLAENRVFIYIIYIYILCIYIYIVYIYNYIYIVYIYIVYIYIYNYIYIYELFYVQKWLPKSGKINCWLTSGQWGLIQDLWEKNNQTSLTWGLPASRTSPSVGGLQEGLSGNGDLIPKYLSLGVKSLCALVIHMDHRFWFVCNSVLSTNILWMEEILHHLGWLKPYK